MEKKIQTYNPLEQEVTFTMKRFDGKQMIAELKNRMASLIKLRSSEDSPIYKGMIGADIEFLDRMIGMLEQQSKAQEYNSKIEKGA